MKKSVLSICLACAVGVAVTGVTACQNANEGFVFKAIAREDGSGTRNAFDELVQKKGVSLRTAQRERDFAAKISKADATSLVISQVSKRGDTLGYISLGTVGANSERVKTVRVEGVEATAENVKNGAYPLARPFHLVYQSYEELSDLAKNFLGFIECADGQAIVNESYIAVSETVVEYTPYAGTTTILTLTGSTSVEPLVSKLAAAYEQKNTGVSINISANGSGQGIADVASGKVELGMSSRDLKESERANGLTAHKIASDGIAVIVKSDCPLTNVTFAQLFDLYMNGEKIPTA